ncbi:FAD-dependent oxidoreductase [Coralloluteibacterium stylophorae]|uniref:FAD-dependent oxidoreductase n=1 Tax=Coralloluteibacterium stylophorae TaxID=1776034 RepID=A0A8J7VRR8_9GAMM|nr:FAD-dependent oxidoreductase [Coralloluteibacterium stylophorae]MBS7456127.1 FAD-dependent oxidoreductase [Coralloluteibacterium stylophorae]
MSAREMLDVAVVGAGVVGSAAALALAAEGLRVALVEARAPAPWQAAPPDLRVYAFAPDNAGLLDRLGVWADIAGTRAAAYRRMRVWDAAGGGELAFDAADLGREELGWIVEHALLVDRLWARLPAAGVRVLCPERVSAVAQDDASATLALESGARLRARLVVAADGAASAVRGLLGIAVDTRDYRQQGVVGYVCTARPHARTAWQRFLPGGPLAFLPSAEGGLDGAEAGHVSSIVWSLPQDEAERVAALDDATFGAEVTRGFDARLGEVVPLSPRAAFPLRRVLARHYVAGRVVLCGDAAHVVHPLAGQGVNLGLRDVAALQAAVRAALRRGGDIGASRRLAAWQRARRSDNVLSAHAFETINRAFSNDALLPTLLRGRALGLAGRLPGLGPLLARHAVGG